MKGRKLDWELVVMFVLCILGVIICLIALPSTIAASRNEGIPGTFTADERFCSRTGCDWLGTFKSDDGTIRITYGGFNSQDVKRSGDKVRAQKVGASVFKMNSQAWALMVIGVVGCLTYVVWFVWALRRRRRRIAAGTLQPMWDDELDLGAPTTGHHIR